MFVSVLAALLATTAQEPSSYPAPAAPPDTLQQEELGDEAAQQAADEAEATAEDAEVAIEAAADEADAAAEAAADEAEAAAETADEAAEEADNEAEDVDVVCRRVAYQDDFGRSRSRKVCRPR
jgi:hypothetical protein